MCVMHTMYCDCLLLQCDHVLQNISAPFICEVPPFKAILDQAIGMADFVFGNETEAAAFGKVEGWETTDVAEIALKIAESKAGAKKPTVVRTAPQIVMNVNRICLASTWLRQCLHLHRFDIHTHACRLLHRARMPQLLPRMAL